MHITALDLMTEDLPRQQAFYGGVLGLPVQLADNRVEVQAGASRLIFRAAPSGWRGAYHFAFNIPHALFGEAKLWAAERARLFPGPDGKVEVEHTNWRARAVYFPDPAGNVLELIARQDVHCHVDAPFDAGKIMSISEIGLAVPDVMRSVAALDGQAGLAPYRAPGPDFAAVGDAQGLLIVVREGRIWFPDTGVPARLLRTGVSLDNAAGASYHIQAGGEALVILPVD